jgi:hypothetical protein
VRGVQIPKPGGGVRQLGIPTVVDRLVQQAFLQVLEPLLDPTFSNSSYGFRRGRGAHDALAQAQKYVAAGRAIVVDMDLEKFFDRVHDILIARLARRVADKRLLRIVRRFLEAGLMQNGVCIERHEGTPQGGLLTPPTILRQSVAGDNDPPNAAPTALRATVDTGRDVRPRKAVLQEASRHGGQDRQAAKSAADPARVCADTVVPGCAGRRLRASARP